MMAIRKLIIKDGAEMLQGIAPPKPLEREINQKVDKLKARIDRERKNIHYCALGAGENKNKSCVARGRPSWAALIPRKSARKFSRAPKIAGRLFWLAPPNLSIHHFDAPGPATEP